MQNAGLTDVSPNEHFAAWQGDDGVEKLVEVTRGSLVESEHWGSIAVADAAGNLLAWSGEPEGVTFYRSSAKPIQAIPVITSGAAARFSLTEAELAIICASHSGEETHVAVVGALLAKLGLSADALLCGVHPPFHKPSAQAIWQQGQKPGPLHCNCSGKHSGMLAICVHNDWSLANYLDIDHPLQQMLLRTMQDYHAYENIAVGVDGCGVPVYALPLSEMAKGYARLVDPDRLPAEVASAAHTLVHAMITHPSLVAGSERLDTILMEATGGRLVSKGGAEGVQCIGWQDKGIGIAIKIADGAARAIEPVAIEVLQQLGVLSEPELEVLATRHRVPIKNHRRDIVGELRPVFKLHGLGSRREPVVDR
ncbi:MAG: asparaginase [Peptococcaceae bacterium]|nr:asparaginase [Peptococcaceae bacterium]